MVAYSKSLLWLLVMLPSSMLVGYFAYCGWTRTAPDFPSYYTAAVLLRRGEQVRHFYDMPYFQAQMDLAGMKNQLGGYIPQTPATMFPFVPLAGVPVLSAKRIWLVGSLVLLGITVWLLQRITYFSVPAIIAIVALGFGSVYVNILLGQYYILLTCLLATSVLCFKKKLDVLAGGLLGLIFGLKLLTAPFFLYFAVRRQWKALGGMCATASVLAFLVIAIFGWPDLAFYATHILPRSLVGETLDPYNPGNGTLTTLLRRTFCREAELNPDPALNLPWLFFFLRPLVALSILWVSVLAFRDIRSDACDLAGLFISLVLLSPNTASYTFFLLVVPVSLLLQRANRWVRILLLTSYFLAALPMRPSWSWMFPKVWALAALFVTAVVRYGQPFSRNALWFGVSGAAFASFLVASFNLGTYRKGADQRWVRLTTERGAIYSSSPVSLPNGLIYESIRNNHYVLGWARDGQLSHFTFQGDAFSPVLRGAGLVQFTLISNGIKKPMLLEPATGSIHSIAQASPKADKAYVPSPDGKWVAFTRSATDSMQVFIRARPGQPTVQVTEGHCNSSAPAWAWDSSAILFASDCGRGVGLPALYRASLSDVLELQKAK